MLGKLLCFIFGHKMLRLPWMHKDVASFMSLQASEHSEFGPVVQVGLCKRCRAVCWDFKREELLPDEDPSPVTSAGDTGVLSIGK